jgi:MFS family permease
VQSANSVAVFAGSVLGLGLLYGTICGPLAAFWSELFYMRYRYTALSTIYQVSGVVASGLTPLIAAWLVTRGSGSLWWAAAYNVLVAAISLTSARFLPEMRGRDLATAIADEPSEQVLEPASAS